MRPIDADALIQKWENVHSKDTSFAMAVIGAINDVKHAPTIDAEPVIHGKWLTAYGEHISFGVRPHVSFCSQCNEVTAFKYRYCPNCGARMDEK